MPSTSVRRYSSTTTPLSILAPVPARRSVTGSLPRPTTTKSHSMRRPRPPVAPPAGHAPPGLRERRRPPGADKTHPHHDRFPARGDLRADAVGVSHGAQIIDAVEVEARDGDTLVPAPRRDEELVVGNALPTLELDHLHGGVHPSGPNPEPALDAILVVEAGRLHQRALERELTPEILLGQRRSLVRRPRPRPPQEHPPLETPPAGGW